MDVDEEASACPVKVEGSAGVLGFPREGQTRVASEAEWRRLLKSWSRGAAEPPPTDGRRGCTWLPRALLAVSSPLSTRQPLVCSSFDSRG